MPSEAESAVAAFFHTSRAAAKRARRAQPSDFDRRFYEIVKERLRLEEQAARDAYERSLD